MSSSANSSKARKKRQGPIRSEAVIPFLIVAVLFTLYFTLFFDSQLRSGIQWLGTRLNGAEVNVGTIRTSFWKASFLLKDLEVTDPQEPAKNRLQVGKVEFQLLWDALLRAKFAATEIVVSDIGVNALRKSPGRVFPPQTTDEAATASWKNRLLSGIQDQLGVSSLAGAAKMLEGFDPAKQLEGLALQFKSAGRVKELQAELSRKQSQWKASANSLPGEKDVTELETKLRGVKTGGGPAEIAGQVQQITSIINETNAKLSALKTQAGAISGDMQGFGRSMSDLDALARSDRAQLESRIKLPRLDAETLSKQLFGPIFLGRIAGAEKYIAFARKYMPAKGTKGKNATDIPAHVRDLGKTYQFGTPRSFPLVWIQKVELSSSGANSPFGGDLKGEILDVCSDQPTLGKPTQLKVTGAFPKEGISKLDFKAVLDHRTEIPEDSIQGSVSGLPIDDRVLSDSEGLKFAIAKAVSNIGLDATFRGDAISLSLTSVFENVDYRISADSKPLETVLRSAVKDIPSIRVVGRAKGTWDHLDLAIESNLGSALETAFRKRLQAQLAETRKQVNALFQEKVGKQKDALTRQYGELSSGVNGVIDGHQKKFEALLNEAQAKLARSNGTPVPALPKLPF